MTTPPVASVVVPTHRGAHRLPVLLDALAAQDVEVPWEVVVVLDGPDPATEAVLAAAPGGLPLVVVRRPTAGGPAAALNDGVAASRGRVVVRCDDDLTPAPDMLARHLAHHDADEPVGVIGPTRDEHPDSAYARAYGRRASSRALAGVLAAAPEDRWRHWAAHVSVRRQDLEAVGGYDATFSYREDSELGLRLARHGVRLLVDPDLVLPHRGAPADARTRVGRAWVSGASEVRFRERHPDVGAPPADPPTSTGARLWRVATSVLAPVLRSRAAAARAGSVADALLPRVPASAGGRVVDLLVEAAAEGGRRRGSADQGAFGAQKADELAREARRRPGGAG